MKALTIPGPQDAKCRLAQPYRLFQHRVEHRREVAGRTVDDPQYLGGRSFSGQRLVQFGRALLQFALEIGNFLQGICYLLAGHQPHSRNGLEVSFRPDHTLISTDLHELLGIGGDERCAGDACRAH
jgi:hypothetical protein